MSERASDQQIAELLESARELAADELRHLSKRTDVGMLARPVVVALVVSGLVTRACDAEPPAGAELHSLGWRAMRHLLLLLRAAAEDAVGEWPASSPRDLPRALEHRRST